MASLTLLLSAQLFGEAPQPARFEPHFKGLREIFKEKDNEKLLDALIKGGRGYFFSVQGLSRIYEEKYPDTMEPMREQSKLMEDLIGKLVDDGIHLKYAQDVGADPRVVRHVKAEQKENRKELLQLLRDQKWIDAKDTRLDKWERKIEKTEWDGPKKDRIYILQKMYEFTQQLRHKDWDMNDLQDGMHDFRRRVRWLSIYTRTLADLMVMDDRSLGRWDAILEDPIAQSDYAKMPEVEKLKFPILIPKQVMLELTKAIEELGDAKDTGEAQNDWLKNALFKSGVASSEREAYRMAVELSKRHPKYSEVAPVGKRIFARLRANDHRYEPKNQRGILVALKEAFKEQMDWDLDDCREAMKDIGR